MSRPGEGVSSEDFEFAALSEARNYRAKLLEDFSAYLRGGVLEVGAGIGQITKELSKVRSIHRLLSIEPDPSFCERIRFNLPHHELVEGTIADLEAGGDWNAILSINVLEHIEQDEKELAEYSRVLHRTNGALCLFVPARPEIYAPIDKDFGHFRRYTRVELKRKLERNGFQIVKLRYYNLAGYFAWWLSFCLLKNRAFNVSAVRLFDRAVFPVVHALESHVCPPPFGQSLLAIALAK